MKSLLLFAAAGCAVLALVSWIIPSYADANAASAIRAAAMICFASALVAMVPVAAVATRHPDWIMQAGLAAMTIRMMLTLAGGGLYLRLYAPPKWTFMTAGIISYLILLAAETTLTLRLVGRYWKPPSLRLQ